MSGQSWTCPDGRHCKLEFRFSYEGNTSCKFPTSKLTRDFFSCRLQLHRRNTVVQSRKIPLSGNKGQAFHWRGSDLRRLSYSARSPVCQRILGRRSHLTGVGKCLPSRNPHRSGLLFLPKAENDSRGAWVRANSSQLDLRKHNYYRVSNSPRKPPTD